MHFMSHATKRQLFCNNESNLLRRVVFLHSLRLIGPKANAFKTGPNREAEASAKESGNCRIQPLAAKEKPLKMVKSPPPMVALRLHDFTSGKLHITQSITANPFVFDVAPRIAVLHQAHTWERACKRAGSALCHSRGQKPYSGRKLRPQKGTGRARMGDRAAPHLRHGGKAHGPKPKSYAYSLPKKIVRLAFRIMLSQKLRESNIMVFNHLHPIADDLGQYLKRKSYRKFCVVDIDTFSHLEERSFGMKNVEILNLFNVQLSDLLKNQVLVISLEAIRLWERYLMLDGMPRADFDAYYKEKQVNYSLEECFANTIRTPRRRTHPHIIYKSQRRTVYSKRYDMARKLLPKKKLSRGLGKRG